MDDDVKNALQEFSDRMARLETKAEGIAIDVSDLTAHVTKDHAPQTDHTGQTDPNILPGFDEALVHRTLAEARAVLDEYYGTFLSKVRVELGLPTPQPVPVGAPSPALADANAAPRTGA